MGISESEFSSIADPFLDSIIEKLEPLDDIVEDIDVTCAVSVHSSSSTFFLPSSALLTPQPRFFEGGYYLQEIDCTHINLHFHFHPNNIFQI